jgi:4-amino-4-deoxy-L-arabinose transferase-like glycosyltransferase
VFAVASVGLIYLVARQLGGPLAGIAAAALTLINPLLTTVWTRALAESIVAAFGLLALAIALRVMPFVADLGKRAWLPLTLGAALALSAATKLNGGLGALGLAVFALVQQGLAVAETRRTRGFRSWVDAALMAVVLFVVLNPLLYVMPVERAIGLIRHRHDEMEFQRSVFTRDAVPDEVGARIRRVAKRTFDDYATPNGSLPASPDVVLVPLGICVLAWRAIVELRRRFAGPALLLLCWLGTTYLVVTPNLGFDSSHYFAPLVALNVIVGGVALSAGARGAWHLARLVIARRRGRQNVQVPST